jgi:hypothetical protein
MAARQGVIPMAAHQISMQIWLAASLLTDAVALAGQVWQQRGQSKPFFWQVNYWLDTRRHIITMDDPAMVFHYIQWWTLAALATIGTQLLLQLGVVGASSRGRAPCIQCLVCSGQVKPFGWHVYSWLDTRRHIVTRDGWPCHSLSLHLVMDTCLLAICWSRHPIPTLPLAWLSRLSASYSLW